MALSTEKLRAHKTHLVSKMLDDESAVGHAGLLEERAGLQVGVIELLSPRIVRPFGHLAAK